jgi:hypothetical protein
VGAGVLSLPALGARRRPDVRRRRRLGAPDPLRRLVLAHVGRPTIRPLDRGEALPFGELGKEKQVY